MSTRIRQLKAELRQEHKAFLRVLKLWPQVPEKRWNGLLVPMNMDQHVLYPEQNCQINPDL